MKLSGFLEKELTVACLKPSTKSKVLDELLKVVEKSYPIGERKKILADLITRESQTTTGIGCNIAIPHTIVERLDKTLLCLASIPEGMEFQSVDRKPVKVIFLLLSPPKRVKEHIKLLARIARICSSQTLVRKISEATTADEIIDVIKREDERHVG